MEQENAHLISSSPVKPVMVRLTPVCYLLGLAFFFLPFLDIRCNNVSLQQVSGMNLATGFKIKTPDNGSILGNLDQADQGDFSFTKNGSERKFNPYALFALLGAIVATILALLPLRGREKWSILTGIITAAALIGLRADIRSQIKLDLSARTDSVNIHVAVDFTAWFYITVFLFLAGAFFSYRSSVANT